MRVKREYHETGRKREVKSIPNKQKKNVLGTCRTHQSKNTHSGDSQMNIKAKKETIPTTTN